MVSYIPLQFHMSLQMANLRTWGGPPPMWESLYSADTVVPNKDVIMFCSYAPDNRIGGVFLTCCGFSPLPFLFCQWGKFKSHSMFSFVLIGAYLWRRFPALNFWASVSLFSTHEPVSVKQRLVLWHAIATWLFCLLPFRRRTFHIQGWQAVWLFVNVCVRVFWVLIQRLDGFSNRTVFLFCRFFTSYW